MLNLVQHKCYSCLQSYIGADDVLRCRVSSNGLKCSINLSENCERYIYEPGTDAKERNETNSEDPQGNPPGEPST
jgi:hypothetical protein